MNSYWFIPLIVESILLLLLIAYDNGFLATVSLIITLAVIHFAGFANLLNIVSSNPLGILYCAVGYVVAGVAWSLVKWTLFVLKDKKKYLADKKKYFTEHPDKTEEENQQGWVRSFRGNRIAPQVSEHKYDIMRWMFYWPFSMTSTIVRDFTRKVYTVVYNSIKDTFQSISNKIYEDIDK